MVSLRRGFGWNALNQGTTIAVTLLIVPVLVGGLGLAAYGVLVLAQSATGLLQALDGGMLNAAARHFGITAGAEDQQRGADYFVTVTLVVLTIAGLLGAGLFFLSAPISGWFHVSRSLRPDLVYAARVVAVMLPLGLFAGVVTAVLTVHGQFRYLATTNMILMIAYAGAVIALVGHRHGVETVMQITLCQQGALVLLTLPRAMRYVNVLRGRLLPRADVRALLSYATQMQIAALTSVVNSQADALIVGAVLPVRFVGLYGVGANFAAATRSVPLNLASPLVARLTQTLGRSGEEAAFREYARIQTIWVAAAAAFSALTMGAAIFEIEAWLGPRFVVAGVVCVVLQTGNLVNLLTLPLTVYLQAIGRPDLDLRYGLLGAALNLILTVAFIWVGVYGIVGGTAAGQVLGSIALLWLARRAVSPSIPNFVRPVPWRAALIGATASAAAGGVLSALIEGHGVADLVLVSFCLVPGAAAFILAWLGARASWALTVSTVRSRSLTPLVESVAPLAH